MGRIVALLVGLLSLGQAAACTCTNLPIDSATARSAQNVFVFRLLSTQASSSPDASERYQASGKIQVLANVRGKTSAREISYWTHVCCGIRLEAGKEYIGFLPADTEQFGATASNVLPLWDRFGRAEADDLEAVIRGRKMLEDVFSYGRQEIMQMRPPPPPCPTERKRTGQRSNNSFQPKPLRGSA